MNEPDDIVKEFLVESYDNLDRLDRELIDLEKHPSNRDILASLFRTIPSVKGTSGFVASGNWKRLPTWVKIGWRGCEMDNWSHQSQGKEENDDHSGFIARLTALLRTEADDRTASPVVKRDAEKTACPPRCRRCWRSSRASRGCQCGEGRRAGLNDGEMAAQYLRLANSPRFGRREVPFMRLGTKGSEIHQFNPDQSRFRNNKKSALSEIAQDAFGSPPPELPNHVIILCPVGLAVNVTSVMSYLRMSTFGVSPLVTRENVRTTRLTC